MQTLARSTPDTSSICNPLPRRWWGALMALSTVLAMLAVLAPHAAYAQDGAADEALRQTVQFAAISVAQSTLPVATRGSAAQVGADIGSAESIVPPPGVEDLPDAPEDDSGFSDEPVQVPTAVPPTAPTDEAPTDEAPDVLGEAEWVDYSNAGVSIIVPSDWETISPDAETIFATAAPDSEFAIVLIDIGADIPSFIGLTLFRVAAGAMLGEWIPDAQMLSVESAFTAQGLPMVRLDFDAEIEGEEATGSFFVISAGSQAYVLLVAGTVEEFDIYAEEAEEILESLTFDPSLITYVHAEDGPVAYSNDQLSVFLPAGWFAADTGDEQLPVVLLDPAINYVMMLSTDAALDATLGMSMEELFDTEDGTPDPALLDELSAELIDLFGADSDDLFFDPELTETFPREGGLMIRMVGEGDFGDGAVSPVAFYFDLRPDGGAVGMLVGEIDPALDDEQTIRDVVASIDPAE